MQSRAPLIDFQAISRIAILFFHRIHFLSYFAILANFLTTLFHASHVDRFAHTIICHTIVKSFTLWTILIHLLALPPYSFNPCPDLSSSPSCQFIYLLIHILYSEVYQTTTFYNHVIATFCRKRVSR